MDLRTSLKARITASGSRSTPWSTTPRASRSREPVGDPADGTESAPFPAGAPISDDASTHGTTRVVGMQGYRSRVADRIAGGTVSSVDRPDLADDHLRTAALLLLTGVR